MRCRPRTPLDHGSRCLPTRTIRVTRGRVTVEREMGSERPQACPQDVWPTADEWDAMVRERKAVKV